MKNILVLINLSTGAERLATLAYKVAQQFNANVLLCKVYETPVAKPYALSEYRNIRELGDEQHFSIDDLANDVRQQFNESAVSKHQPVISTCKQSSDFNNDKIKAFIDHNHVQMIVTGIDDLLDLKKSDLLTMINKATCPVLVIPDGVNFEALNNGIYLTDLRYCDVKVLSYLKELNAKIFVTHISAKGIPDMEDGYAQGLLSDYATSVKYNKLFLRNVKGLNRKKVLETITAMEKIQFIVTVNEKHNLLEGFLADTAVNRRNYHGLPLLIMPYLNWQYTL